MTTGIISASSMSGSGVNIVDIMEKEKEANETIEKYEKALEIEKKAEKIIKYANKNNLDVQETLESFFSEEELELYENISFLRAEVAEIQDRGKLKKKQEDFALEKYMKKHRKKCRKKKSVTITPWIPAVDTTGGGFNENDYIKYISKNTSNLHLLA